MTFSYEEEEISEKPKVIKRAYIPPPSVADTASQKQMREELRKARHGSKKAKATLQERWGLKVLTKKEIEALYA